MTCTPLHFCPTLRILADLVNKWLGIHHRALVYFYSIRMSRHRSGKTRRMGRGRIRQLTLVVALPNIRA